MLENRDPAIKLFGKTIPLPSGGDLEEDKGLCSKRESPKSEDKERDDEAMMRSPMASSEQETSTSPTVVEEKNKSNKGEEEKEKEKEKAAAGVMKKPDKILPCPRCNSLDTKFCYYNNYNVNQPRHFCKNCQRYWTAGGTMRNVPVGAGRRKNKNNTSTTCSHYRHLVELPNNATTVLSFASSDTTPPPHHHHHHRSSSSSCMDGHEIVDEQGSSNNSPDDPPALMPYVNWPRYPWNNHPVAPIPIPLYSAAPPVPPYWPTWTTVPWTCSGLTLGKHSREGNVLLTAPPPKQSNNNNNLWFPKTLRIDDPEEAAKSSIWTTMGFRNDKAGGGMFEAFQSKAKLRNHAQQALHANPAAMSRSLNFQETS